METFTIEEKCPFIIGRSDRDFEWLNFIKKDLIDLSGDGISSKPT